MLSYIFNRKIKLVLGWLLFVGILLHAAVAKLFNGGGRKERSAELDTMDPECDPLSKPPSTMPSR